MVSSAIARMLALALLAAASMRAGGDPGNWFGVQFPHDSPVLLVNFNLGSTRVSVRGASMALSLHASLLLRNVSRKPISGLTLRVEAQDLTPYGKGSVIKPSLYVLPGDDFPVRVDMELLRPMTAAKSDGAIVQVSLDCALFTDLEAYGPDKLHSRRTLTVYELQARRDRQYLSALLESGRIPELREELNFGMQDFVPRQIGLELLRGPENASRSGQAMAVSPVLFANSPVQPLGGAAEISGNEVKAPRVEVRNLSKIQVRSVAMGWIVRDDRGKDFVAGAVTSNASIAPVTTASVIDGGTLRFLRSTGQPMVIGALMTFVNDVEFADGKLWIPSRADIDGATADPILRRELATSPEEQRLAQIYRRDGTAGLKRELKRVN